MEGGCEAGTPTALALLTLREVPHHHPQQSSGQPSPLTTLTQMVLHALTTPQSEREVIKNAIFSLAGLAVTEGTPELGLQSHLSPYRLPNLLSQTT